MSIAQIYWVRSKINFGLIILILGIPLVVVAQTVTDYDGNVYQTVTINGQAWMKENLKSLHYNDGSEINNVIAYDNSESNVDTYGRLYNWNAAMKNSTFEKTQGACPDGWHLPSDGEWTNLGQFLGGNSVAGGKLKEAGTGHWNSPNSGATNSSGFTALPAGEHDDVEFRLLNEFAVMWSSTEYSDQWAKYRYLSYNDEELHPYDYFKSFYYSIRCVKNIATDVPEKIFHGVRIYPNPIDHIVFFDQKKIVTESDVTASIFCQNGQLISQFKLQSKLTKKDLYHLSPGIYYVKIRFENRIEYQKILKR